MEAVVVLLIGLAIYLIPTWIAFGNHRRARGGVLVVNLFLGWTFVGWVAALAWACVSDTAKVTS